MISEAQKKAQMRYDKKTKQFALRVNPYTEPDIYERLMNVKNRSGYIKNLVRKDIDG